MNKIASMAFLGLVSSLAFSPSLASAKTVRLDSTQNYKKAGTLAAAPGDTICIASGRRSYQYLHGLTGTAERPIVITNRPEGRVYIGKDFRYGLWLDSVAHVRITGGLGPALEYGIHIDPPIGVAGGSAAPARAPNPRFNTSQQVLAKSVRLANHRRRWPRAALRSPANLRRSRASNRCSPTAKAN